MKPPIREVLVTSAPLRRPEVCFDSVAGGVVEFYGVVRGEEGPEAIAGIDYEAHIAMAEHQLDTLASETLEKFSAQSLLVHHRIGFVAAGEPSLVLRVSAAHRGPAFAAAQWFINEMKQRVPIWKHPLDRTSGREIACVNASTPALSA